MLAVLVTATVLAPSAGAIVHGTSVVGAAFAAPIAYVEIASPHGRTATCSGTLISPTVVMTAAHCVYQESKQGDLLGIATPTEISVRVGSTDVSNPTLGVSAGVVAVLPQPYYRWDGDRHFHDIALLALDRAMPQTPATLAEQAPSAGESLLIAGYGMTSTSDASPPSLLRAALIDAADPSSCKLVSERFDPSWLFCGAASTDPTEPGGTACYGDSGGPAFAVENTPTNVVVEGIISYGSRADCEYSRSYLVLVSSERGFIDRALATSPTQWAQLRDNPPSATIRSVRSQVGKDGVLSLRIDDDKSQHSRVYISFYTHAGKRLGHTFRAVATNRWVHFALSPAPTSFSGYVCAQGADDTAKESNLACAKDVVR
ncbi:MAG: trypsin-like serine protease [Gaiellales bacterium]